MGWDAAAVIIAATIGLIGTALAALHGLGRWRKPNGQNGSNGLNGVVTRAELNALESRLNQMESNVANIQVCVREMRKELKTEFSQMTTSLREELRTDIQDLREQILTMLRGWEK